MSDRTLPAEGEVVLAWWGAAVALAYRDGGRWRCFVNKEIIARDMDGWVSLREAKAARAMGEALRRIADGDYDSTREVPAMIARAALRAAPDAEAIAREAAERIYREVDIIANPIDGAAAIIREAIERATRSE